MADLLIDGKRVVLRDDVPLAAARRLPGLLRQADSDDLATVVPAMRILIESWEFPGDPADAESYDALGTFKQFIPLLNAVQAHVTGLLGDLNGQAKNL